MDCKKCSKCGEVKLLSNFRLKARYGEALRPACKACDRIDSQEYQKRLKENALRGNSKENLKNKAAWLTECENRHQDKFSYNEVVYVTSFTKVKIFCNKHQVFFKQAPMKHKIGVGCPVCLSEHKSEITRSDANTWIKKAKLIRGYQYDYSFVDYYNEKTRVSIKCNSCLNIFRITPDSHTATPNGGCPYCLKTGYSILKSGYLYLLKSGNTYKIGITNKTPEHRLKNINKTSGLSFLTHSFWYFSSGEIAPQIESYFLSKLRQNFKQPCDKFDGSTECFFDLCVDELIGEIDNYIDKEFNK